MPLLTSRHDAKGRITHISDDMGGQVQITYDKTDQPKQISSNRSSVKIDRTAKGQVKQVKTSWGFTEKYEYDDSDNISRITLQQGLGQTAEQAGIELTDGRVSKIYQPDGGETTLDYYKSGKQKGLVKKVKTTENLALSYSYDKSDRLTGIDIGDTNAPTYRVNYHYDTKGRLTGISYSPASGR